jgi:glycosyltransferase involved in cell wall biosynthesis
MSEPIASVVIAAHNEEPVIGRCLNHLTADAATGELEVVVVANACTDRTAQVARAAGARVVETATPGKAHALGLGDRECRAFPRVYLDADVDLSAASVRRMVAALDEQGAMACAPAPHYDLSGTSRIAARFHRVFEQLVSGRRGLAGTGVYVLSRQGHRRVFPLPRIISDDGWVHRGFTEAERMVVPDARSVVRPARTLSAVVRRRARVRLGNRELDRLGRPAHGPAVGGGELVALVRGGDVGWADAALFVAVLLAERTLARWRALRGAGSHWSADRGSRADVSGTVRL